MPSSSAALARTSAQRELTDLAETLQSDGGIFSLSRTFLECRSVGDDCYAPLDGRVVVLNAENNRYHAPTALGLHQDDWILLSMVMFHLHRLEHGLGKSEMIRRHLSIYQGGIFTNQQQQPSISALKNLWENEIAQLKTTGVALADDGSASGKKKKKKTLKLGKRDLKMQTVMMPS